MLRPLVISKLQVLEFEKIHLLKHKLLYYSTLGIKVNTYKQWGAIQYIYIYRYKLYTAYD